MSEELCAICLEKTDDDCYIAVCCKKNKFHFECLDKWFKIKNTCPLCREEYTHMKDYSDNMEEYLDNIKNIDVKQIVDNIHDNLEVFKVQCNELQFNTLSNIFDKTQQFLEVIQEYYEKD